MSASLTNPSIVLKKVGEIVQENRPEPQITDDHYVKLLIKKTGICGSDVHYYTHGKIGDFVVKAPMVLGHESSGVVVEIGSKVTRVKVGDKVAIEPGVPSRYSDEFKSGNYNLCPHMAFAATPPYDGTLVKYYLSPEDFLVKLPSHVSYEEGALVEPLAVGVHAAKRAGVRFNSRVVVFGAGPVGLLAAAVSKAFGATQVLVVDVVDSKLEMAKDLGATHVLNSLKTKNFKQSVLELLGEEPNIILEATGAEICIRNGIHIVKAGGSFVQVGMGKDDINFPIAELTTKEVKFTGNFRYSHGDYTDAVELISLGIVKASKVISHRYKFEDAKLAYDNNVKNSKDVVKTMIDGPEEVAKL